TNAYDKENETKKTNTRKIKTHTKYEVEDIAKSSGNNAKVIGSKSGALEDNDIAVGRGAFSQKDISITIGYYS
ncbi:hypothetical protein, partial [Streptobacillus moniliformis]|uniref:hypothetical protein n=1 Tax=Streptobacillus moniliformis TaxID=34105 RepID=UPI000A89CC67